MLLPYKVSSFSYIDSNFEEFKRKWMNVSNCKTVLTQGVIVIEACSLVVCLFVAPSGKSPTLNDPCILSWGVTGCGGVHRGAEWRSVYAEGRVNETN
jgi:hypothetical protein